MLARLIFLFTDDAWLHTVIEGAGVGWVTGLLVTAADSLMIEFVILSHLDIDLGIPWLRELRMSTLIIMYFLF